MGKRDGELSEVRGLLAVGQEALEEATAWRRAVGSAERRDEEGKGALWRRIVRGERSVELGWRIESPREPLVEVRFEGGRLSGGRAHAREDLADLWPQAREKVARQDRVAHHAPAQILQGAKAIDERQQLLAQERGRLGR